MNLEFPVQESTKPDKHLIKKSNNKFRELIKKYWSHGFVISLSALSLSLVFKIENQKNEIMELKNKNKDLETNDLQNKYLPPTSMNIIDPLQVKENENYEIIQSKNYESTAMKRQLKKSENNVKEIEKDNLNKLNIKKDLDNETFESEDPIEKMSIDADDQEEKEDVVNIESIIKIAQGKEPNEILEKKILIEFKNTLTSHNIVKTSEIFDEKKHTKINQYLAEKIKSIEENNELLNPDISVFDKNKKICELQSQYDEDWATMIYENDLNEKPQEIIHTQGLNEKKKLPYKSNELATPTEVAKIMFKKITEEKLSKVDIILITKELKAAQVLKNCIQKYPDSSGIQILIAHTYFYKNGHHCDENDPKYNYYDKAREKEILEEFYKCEKEKNLVFNKKFEDNLSLFQQVLKNYLRFQQDESKKIIALNLKKASKSNKETEEFSKKIFECIAEQIKNKKNKKLYEASQRNTIKMMIENEKLQIHIDEKRIYRTWNVKKKLVISKYITEACHFNLNDWIKELKDTENEINVFNEKNSLEECTEQELAEIIIIITKRFHENNDKPRIENLSVETTITNTKEGYEILDKKPEPDKQIEIKHINQQEYDEMINFMNKISQQKMSNMKKNAVMNAIKICKEFYKNILNGNKISKELQNEFVKCIEELSHKESQLENELAKTILDSLLEQINNKNNESYVKNQSNTVQIMIENDIVQYGDLIGCYNIDSLSINNNTLHPNDTKWKNLWNCIKKINGDNSTLEKLEEEVRGIFEYGAISEWNDKHELIIDNIQDLSEVFINLCKQNINDENKTVAQKTIFTKRFDILKRNLITYGTKCRASIDKPKYDEIMQFIEKQTDLKLKSKAIGLMKELESYVHSSNVNK